MRKLWLILAALLLACCVTAALAEDALDLDALMAEIDSEEVSLEELKGLTDGIYFIDEWMNEAFFTTSSYKEFERENEIVNYRALKEALGGEPTVTVSGTGGAVEFAARFREENGFLGLAGYVHASIVCGGDDVIPRSAADTYNATVTVTWGGLSASFPVRARVLDYTGPALTGIAGIPDTVSLGVGEALTLSAQPDPAGWSWPGMRMLTDISWRTADSQAFEHMIFDRVDDEHTVVSFDQAGVYPLYVSLIARYQYNGVLKPVFEVEKLLTIQVDGGTGTEQITLRSPSLSKVVYTGSDEKYIGLVMIMNYHKLKETLGGQPTLSCTPTGREVEFSPSVNEWGDNGAVEMRITYPDSNRGAVLSESWVGEYSTEVTVTWGSLTATLPVSVVIKPYQGQELLGIVGLPDTIELAVGEVWHLDLKPDPADFACPDGLYLRASWGWRYDPDNFNYDDVVVSGLQEYLGDTSYDVAFRRPLKVDFVLTLGVADAMAVVARDVMHTVHVVVVDKPAPQPTDQPLPTDPPIDPTFPPVEPTDPPVEPTDPPVEPTDPPVQPLAIQETRAVYEISPDGKSIFIDKPTITGGVAPYTIAYNCYDAQSNPVNYYYSDDARTAMSPGYNGRFNVFVVVRDSAGGQAQIDTGWQDLSGYGPLPLSVVEEVAVSEISPDGRSIFINQPTVSGGTGNYTFAYNCYDAQSQPVNYYYSNDARTAMTPGYAGRFCVFVVVSDGNESIIINTGWYDLKE